MRLSPRAALTKKPEPFNPKITLMSAPERFFAKFGPSKQETKEMTQDNVYAKPLPWDELKIHAAFRGLSITTVEYEMQRLEHKRTFEWDSSPYSFAWRV